MRHKTVPIDQQLDNLLHQQIAKNREIMSSLFKTVIFCVRNNIALRGRRDDDSSKEALLYFRVDSGDHVLKEHLETSARNATRNEMITTVGKYIITGLPWATQCKNEIVLRLGCY